MMKIRNSQLRFLGSLVLVLIIIYLTRGLIFFDKNLKENQLDLCLSKKEESFSGKVSEVYISWKTDTLNVFAFKIINQDNERLIYNYCLVSPEAYIQKGDSIYKVPNSFEYHIYKGGDSSREEVIRCEDSICDKWR